MTQDKKTFNPPCPCKTGKSYSECCEPFHNKKAFPSTAETLMRARYCAYAVGAIDFIVDTHNPNRMQDIDREAIEDWSRGSEWLGLEILNTEKGKETDDRGTVEFVAHFTDAKGKINNHHEKSSFLKKEGKWHYEDGEIFKSMPIKREEAKVGRNDDCPCGSGKKYKKCCMK